MAMEKKAELKLILRFPGNGGDSLYHLAWNPNPSPFASSSSSSSSHHNNALCMASIGADNTAVRLWDLFMSSSPPSSSLNKVHFEGVEYSDVRCCAWSQCGRLLAVSSIDRSTYIYRYQQNKDLPLLHFYLAQSEDLYKVNSVSWSASSGGSSSMIAVSGGAKYGVSIWKINTEHMVSAPWISDMDYVADETAFRIVSRRRENLFPDAGEEPYSEVILVESGRDMITIGCVWRVKKDKDFTLVAFLRGHENVVNSVQWHPKVDVLFSCSSDHTVKIWAPRAQDWRCVQTLDESNGGHNSAVLDLSFNASGDKMVTCSADGTLKVWQIENAGLQSAERFMQWSILSTLTGYHEGTIFSVDWSREGVIATGGEDGIGIFLEINENEDDDDLYKFLLKEKAHEENVNSVQWSPGEDRVLASASEDGLIKVWKLEQEDEDPMEISDPTIVTKEDHKRGNPDPNAESGSRPKRPRRHPKSWKDYICIS